MFASEPFLPDPVLKAGKLFFKCPTCAVTINLAQRQIDPIVGINIACPGCKNISHLPGAFRTEPIPPGYMITAGVQVPIEGFTDWYYGNAFITGLLHSGQSDLLNDYGLWGFCGACHHQFTAKALTSLAISQSMTQRGAGSDLFPAGTSDSGKDLQALQSGHCPLCGNQELIVIATVIPDMVRNAIPKIKKNTACVTASRASGEEAVVQETKTKSLDGQESKRKNYKGILAILAAACALTLLVWVMLTHPDLSFLTVMKSPTTTPLPTSTSTSIPEEATPTSLPAEPSQASGICWTFPLTGFDGTRAQVWEKILDERTKSLLQYDQFLVDVVLNNPQLKDDGYVLYAAKTYTIPEMCH